MRPNSAGSYANCSCLSINSAHVVQAREIDGNTRANSPGRHAAPRTARHQRITVGAGPAHKHTDVLCINRNSNGQRQTTCDARAFAVQFAREQIISQFAAKRPRTIVAQLLQNCRCRVHTAVSRVGWGDHKAAVEIGVNGPVTLGQRASYLWPHMSEAPLSNSVLKSALATRDAGQFCTAILPAVSRTFALGIKVLPGHLGQAVLDAYLLCRIADTIEDAPAIDPLVKAGWLDDLLAAFDNADALARLLHAAKDIPGEPAHLTLTQNADLVFQHFAELPAPTRAIVREWVTEMAVGMRKFVLLYPNGIRIQTLDEYREYCYYVAGTVGYMLTDLWREHSSSIDAGRYERLRERCRAFAEALQTVNILKDVAVDVEKENSIYIPEALLKAAGSSQQSILAPELVTNNRAALSQLIELAWHDLEEARNYLLLIPRREISIRMFCILPLLLAYATLRDLVESNAMLQSGGSVKITRREVKALLFAGAAAVASNWAVRKLVERVRKRPFA